MGGGGGTPFRSDTEELPGNCAVTATDCYEENKLYVENSLPVSMTLNECFDSCKAVSCCDFFTWNSNSQKCGLRAYHPTSMINAPTQRTGTRSGGIMTTPNKVYVGKSFSTSSRSTCQASCQSNSQCKSVTFNGPTSANPNKCVLNYGPTDRKISVPSGSGIASAPKYC